ncbi:hypothetical protein PsYK624_060100 [Phanerochaete sordida]|uniref:Uncharacterized protein n=1 Tax=Phanerochaete sordida TaxID=48140 RepID=A0A9P3G616_9APHY|nr:hypothetical protein PsYK624_060100 [Phanerochaete sordida]
MIPAGAGSADVSEISDWFMSSRPPIAYSDFRRVMDVALKYNIQDIISEARHRLSEVFQTDSLDDWCVELDPEGDRTPLQISYFDYIDALRLSRLLGMHSITPLLFYVCCNLSPFEKIVDGVQLAGIPEPVTLSQDDLRTCLRGRARLIQESSRIMKAFQELAFDERGRPSACKTPQHCSEALQALSLAVVDAQCFSEPSAIDPMDRWITRHENTADAKPCRHCGKALRNVVNERREETWCKLGEIFGVEEWPAGEKD